MTTAPSHRQHTARGSRGASRRGARGFTLIEVMMAMTVLLIGLMGIVALEKATIVTNVDARQLSTGSSIARVWLERLQTDATNWNHPSNFSKNSDLATDTVYLKEYGKGWILPVGSIGAKKYSASFDLNGNDIDPTVGGDIIYCTNIRLTMVYPDILCTTGGGCPGTTPSMLRTEVRVYWSKRREPLATCDAPPSGGSGGDPIGANEDDYHFVYLVGAVSKVTAQ